MRRLKTLSIVSKSVGCRAAFVMLAVLLSAHLASGDAVWRGGASDQPNQWTHAANWKGGQVPETGADVVFRKPPLRADKVVIDSSVKVGRIQFAWGGKDPGAMHIAAEGKGRLAIQRGVLDVSHAKQVLEAPISLQAEQTWRLKGYKAKLLVKGPVDTGESSLTLTGEGKAAFEGPVHGNGALVVETVYPVFLRGDYRCKGDTEIHSGILALRGLTADCGPVTIGGKDHPAMLTGYPGDPATYTIRYDRDKVQNPIIVKSQGILALSDLRLNVKGEADANQPAYVLADYSQGTLRGKSFASITGKPDGYTVVYRYQGKKQIALVRKAMAASSHRQAPQGGRAKTISVSTPAMQVLNKHLTPEQWARVRAALRQGGYGSLGPRASEVDVAKRVRAHADKTMTLNPRAYAKQGDGSADSPYVNAIGGFFKARHLSTPVVVQVPPGHYREGTMRIPEGVWLVGEPGKTMLRPQPDGIDRKDVKRPAMIKPGANAGVVNFDIGGGRVKNGQPRIVGVNIPHGANHVTILHNTIHDMPEGCGVRGPASRGAVILANHLENIGVSGVRTGSEWLVADNIIQYAGLDREGGGGGDDGVITGKATSGSVVRNNLVFSAKRPNARHAMATEGTNMDAFLGNLLVVEGKVRGGLVLADNTYANRLIGNVILQIHPPGERTRLGIHVFGSLNLVRGNAVIGTTRGASLYHKAGNRVVENYFNTKSGFVNSSKNTPNVVQANLHEKLSGK